MILDALNAEATKALRTTICIVGAGAAGITLACELDATGVQVLLVDAGAIHASKEISQDPYEGSSEGAHATPRFFRRRGFGGTTAIWGGRCVPYDPIDFEARDFVQGSGWPIAYEEVARHYPKAMAYCDAGAFEFNAKTAFTKPGDTIPGMTSADGIQTDGIERYSLPTHFGKRYGAQLAASGNVSVLGPAQVTRLVRDAASGHIAAIECCAEEGGAAFRIEARHFVLATGGIETARLLLASDVGNTHDNVGRYYTCHIENFVGTLRPRRPGAAFHFEKTHDGVYGRRKLTFDPQLQRQERLLNTSFRLHYPNVADASHGSAVLSAVYLARRTLIPEYRRILQYGVGEAVRTSSAWAHARNVATGLPQLAGFGVDWTRRRILAKRKLPYVLVPNADGSFVLEFNAEQTPLRQSRITLSDQKDGYGVPRVHVAWKLADDDIESLCRGYRRLRQSLQEEGAAVLDFNDAALRETIAASVPLGGHHIGTTRMASSPALGVVDRHSAVFDAPNLFIASSSVFPTSSHANPTLTIVAMAIRLAEHLRNSVAQENKV
ncbi:GMC oxidoreductase [Variovorax sp. HJSM1_2]|uniref:GMC oxidoreductase n=1 Tax=Variovorax sp. HJSM1_2 TaxID=3366263 RepID=UPI003BEB7DC2